METDEDNDQCKICFANPAMPQQVCMQCFSDDFCLDCWAKNNSKCPNCRYVPSKTIRDLRLNILKSALLVNNLWDNGNIIDAQYYAKNCSSLYGSLENVKVEPVGKQFSYKMVRKLIQCKHDLSVFRSDYFGVNHELFCRLKILHKEMKQKDTIIQQLQQRLQSMQNNNNVTIQPVQQPRINNRSAFMRTWLRLKSLHQYGLDEHHASIGGGILVGAISNIGVGALILCKAFFEPLSILDCLVGSLNGTTALLLGYIFCKDVLSFTDQNGAAHA